MTTVPSTPALEPVEVTQAEYPPRRSLYEGEGGWQDGRLGQAYDLIDAVIRARGDDPFRHPLLAGIESYDIEGKLA